ncbi:antimicrobial peptide NK-lysin-like [Astyanax mexicanus]|uniref:Antimicrobial peptide NK-lysin-like n=1 Tax=Astyanax mexicanus TaxID=7994 RepID=A0A8T2LID1_ASTMX|nr:antimicrobial peptide NK-lysin-like [Astyanax mexicanus]
MYYSATYRLEKSMRFLQSYKRPLEPLAVTSLLKISQTFLTATMPRSILFVFLLVGTACAMHLEYLKVDESEEKHLNGILAVAQAIVQAVAQADDQADIQAEEQQISGGKIPGVCWACKWAMGKLKKHLGTKENADAIKAKLLKVCSGIGLLKKRCENFINKNIDVLTEELSTSDDPKTICTNIGVCKEKPPPQLLQAFPEVQQML